MTIITPLIVLVNNTDTVKTKNKKKSQLNNGKAPRFTCSCRKGKFRPLKSSIKINAIYPLFHFRSESKPPRLPRRKELRRLSREDPRRDNNTTEDT